MVISAMNMSPDSKRIAAKVQNEHKDIHRKVSKRNPKVNNKVQENQRNRYGYITDKTKFKLRKHVQ